MSRQTRMFIYFAILIILLLAATTAFCFLRGGAG